MGTCFSACCSSRESSLEMLSVHLQTRGIGRSLKLPSHLGRLLKFDGFHLLGHRTLREQWAFPHVFSIFKAYPSCHPWAVIAALRRPFSHEVFFHNPPETRYVGNTFGRNCSGLFSHWLFQNLCLAKTWAAKDIF